MVPPRRKVVAQQRFVLRNREWRHHSAGTDIGGVAGVEVEDGSEPKGLLPVHHVGDQVYRRIPLAKWDGPVVGADEC